MPGRELGFQSLDGPPTHWIAEASPAMPGGRRRDQVGNRRGFFMRAAVCLRGLHVGVMIRGRQDGGCLASPVGGARRRLAVRGSAVRRGRLRPV
jgi:hypothetical protein